MFTAKLVVKQVSGRSSQSGGIPDEAACSLLQAYGFVPASKKIESWVMNMGCKPAEGKNFSVHYEEPTNPKERFSGRFRLVRQDGNQETLLDEGQATKTHFHEALRKTTFYGRGQNLKSWSFHCELRLFRSDFIYLLSEASFYGVKLFFEALSEVDHVVVFGGGKGTQEIKPSEADILRHYMSEFKLWTKEEWDQAQIPEKVQQEMLAVLEKKVI